MQRKNLALHITTLLAIVLIFVCGRTQADWIQTIDIAAPDNGFGLPVDASANFFFDSGTGDLTVTLMNLTVDPRAVNQNLSGLFMTFNTGQSTGTLSNSLGVERMVAGDKSYTDSAAVATGWDLLGGAIDPLFGTVGLHLDLLSTGTSPTHTIIGLPDAKNFYGNANSSIAGNGPHNPFIGESATFVLNIPGLSNASRVSNTTFQFNTAPGTYFGVPEPSSFALLGLCLGCLGLRRSRNRHPMA